MARSTEQLEIELILNAQTALESLSKLTVGTQQYQAAFADALVRVQNLAELMGKSIGDVGAAIASAFNSEPTNRFLAIMQILRSETEALLLTETKLGALQNVESNAMRDQLTLIQQMAAADAENVNLNMTKRAAMENVETQAMRTQLELIQQMAAADASRLGNSMSVSRPGAISPNGTPAPMIQSDMDKIAIANQRIAEAERQVLDTSIPLNAEQQKLAKNLKDLEPAAGSAGKGFSVLRSAMGFLTAMAMSAIANAVIQMLQKIIDSANQLEQSFIKLGIAERSLSAAGIEITPQQLADIANSVTNTYKTISSIDALKMISNLAVLTKDLKLSADQYKKLAMAIPLVSQQAGVSIESATNQVITGLTKSGRGWADLGITVDAAVIRQEAITMGLVKNAAAYKALTAEQKQQVEVIALINILDKNTSGNLQDQSKYLGSIAGKQAGVTKAWEELTTSLGVLASPALKAGLDALIAGLENLQRVANGFNQSSDVMNRFMESVQTLSGIDLSKEQGFFSQLLDVLNPFETIFSVVIAAITPMVALIVTSVKLVVDLFNGVSLKTAFSNAGTNLGNALITGFSQALAVGLAGETGMIATWIKKQWKEATGVDLSTFGAKPAPLDASGMKDTATGNPASIIPDVTVEPDTAQKKIDDAFAKLKTDLETQAHKLEQDKIEAKINLDLKLGDIGTAFVRKLEDIALEVRRKIEDVLRDSGVKIASINADSNRAIADANQTARNNDVKAEQEYQNRLQTMREQYLMDLEDALHARDARAVLKLMKKYALDRAQAARDFAAGQRDRANSTRQDIIKINQDRIIKINAVREEEKQKLAEIELWRQRELEDAKIKRDREAADARTDYANKMADLRRADAERIKELGRAMQAEFNLTQQQANALRQMLQGNLNAYSQYQAAILAQNQAGMNSRGGVTPASTGSGTTTTNLGATATASGGTRTTTSTSRGNSTLRNGGATNPADMNKPTSLWDALGQGLGLWKMGTSNTLPAGTSKQINSSYSMSGAGQGGGGTVGVELFLSPDLESRIVQNTLNETANVMLKVRKSR